ncbi:hypothetical protein KXW54_005735, partial [Aspergillus fumigatus]
MFRGQSLYPMPRVHEPLHLQLFLALRQTQGGPESQDSGAGAAGGSGCRIRSDSRKSLRPSLTPGNPSALASLPATSTCTSTATTAAAAAAAATTTTIATTTAPSQGPAVDSAAAAAAATTSTVASPRADDCLGLFDDDEESNPFFSSGSENTGGTS